MILKLYKSNTTLVLFGLPLIMSILWLPSFLSPTLLEFNSNSFLFDLFYLENPLLNKISAFLIILFTGILLNTQVNKNEIFERNTYIPALFYVLMMSSVSEIQQMHPIVISNLFWVLAYRRLLNVYNQVQCKSEIFDASIFIVLGSLITFPSAGLLILLPWFTLIVIRPFEFKEYMMPVFGVTLFFVYLAAYYYINPVEITFLNLESSYKNFDLPFNWTYYGIYGIIIIIMYLSAFKLISKSNTSSVRFRKTTSVLLAFLALSFMAMMLEKIVYNNDIFLLLGTVPFSLLWSFYFFYNEKKWVGGVIFYGMLGLILINLYYF